MSRIDIKRERSPVDRAICNLNLLTGHFDGGVLVDGLRPGGVTPLIR